MQQIVSLENTFILDVCCVIQWVFTHSVRVISRDGKQCQRHDELQLNLQGANRK